MGSGMEAGSRSEQGSRPESRQVSFLCQPSSYPWISSHDVSPSPPPLHTLTGAGSPGAHRGVRYPLLQGHDRGCRLRGGRDGIGRRGAHGRQGAGGACTCTSFPPSTFPNPLHNFVPIPHLRARSLTHLLARGCCLTPLPSLPPSFSLPWQVQLVAPHYDILDGCPEGQRLAAKKVLAGLGVEIITGA